MQEEFKIDIVILHVAGSDKIRVHFPEQTRRLWKVLTAKTRYYLCTPEVQDFILQENPRVLEEWIMAQKALERLSYMPGPHQLSIDEGNSILNLIIGATLYWHSNGDSWEHTESMLLTAARLSRLELDCPRTAATSNRKGKDGDLPPHKICFPKRTTLGGLSQNRNRDTSVYGHRYLKTVADERDDRAVLDFPSALSAGMSLAFQEQEFLCRFSHGHCVNSPPAHN